MATEVIVERAVLDEEQSVLYKEYDRRVRMAFDPRRITEPLALVVLVMFLPRLSGAMTVTHPTSA